ncbi:MAG: DUF2442 domain-containing protein [Chloroflexota bacterium]
MLRDIVAATHLGEYRIELVFDDGQRGVVDLAPYAERGGVFERFRDMRFFREFRVHAELGTLTWGDEVDLAPETLYALATGSPLPDWMTPEEAVA